MTPRIGSLCSGYGGLDLGVAAVIGGTVAWHVEHAPAPSAILAHHWPDVPNHGDVIGTDWSRVEPVDVLTAGYPCQPFSLAGRREGTTDDRHLWPHVAHAIGALRPRLVVLENVSGHLSLGFDRVLGDLAALGYDARWGVVRASDAGAPHTRARLFVAATPDPGRGPLPGHPVPDDGLSVPPERGVQAPPDPGREGREPAAEGAPPGRRPIEGTRPHDTGMGAVRWGTYAPAVTRWERITGRPAPVPTEPGRSGPRLRAAFVEWLMGLDPGHVTGAPIPRTEQLRALGNGVVPQQAALALRTLLAPS